jgi:hypothetical protein
MNKQHKHHDLIVAWAKGADIQYKDPCAYKAEWQDIEKPNWLKDMEYRIKPTPKPDIVINTQLYMFMMGDVPVATFNHNTEKPNVDLTFDGETLKLKQVVVL